MTWIVGVIIVYLVGRDWLFADQKEYVEESVFTDVLAEICSDRIAPLETKTSACVKDIKDMKAQGMINNRVNLHWMKDVESKLEAKKKKRKK